MLKKLILLAMAAMAVFAIGAQGASANWYHGLNPLAGGQDPHIDVTGDASFTSANGGTSCPVVHSTIQLTGGTTTAHIKSFTVTNPGTCEVSGGLVFLTGGTTTLESATLTNTETWKPQFHLIKKNEKHHLSITGVQLHNKYKNGFSLTLESAAAPLTVTLEDAAGGQTGPISKLTVDKSKENVLKSGLGEVEVTLHGHVVSPTYGVTPGSPTP